MSDTFQWWYFLAFMIVSLILAAHAYRGWRQTLQQLQKTNHVHYLETINWEKERVELMGERSKYHHEAAINKAEAAQNKHAARMFRDERDDLQRRLRNAESERWSEARIKRMTKAELMDIALNHHVIATPKKAKKKPVVKDVRARRRSYAAATIRKDA